MAAANVSNHLTTQVGGHPGVSSTEDGSLLIKPALPTEVAFYHTLGEDPRLAGLKDFVPEFYGTLRLEGKVESESAGLDMNTIQPVTDIPESEKDESRHTHLVVQWPDITISTMSRAGESLIYFPQTEHTRYQAGNCASR